jgi:hypothetical protein
MRKLVASELVSVDGVMESPEKWQLPYFDDEMGEAIWTAMAAADAMPLGRVTYEERAIFFPFQSSEDVPPADYMNDTPKFVVSTTLQEPLAWNNSTLIKGRLTGDHQVQVATRQGYRYLRQRHARPVAAAREPPRRTQAHGPSGGGGQRHASLRGRGRSEGAGACRL